MQRTSIDWQNIVSGASFVLQTRVVCDNKAYDEISAPIIEQSLATRALSVGNFNAASLQVSVRTDDIFPESAALTVLMRVTDGESYSEWLPMGDFWISRRQHDRVAHIYSFTCYDAALKAGEAYIRSAEEAGRFPMTMYRVVLDIASRIGVSVDDRTWEYITEDDDYAIPSIEYPSTKTMQEMLEQISACYGGNFCITPAGKLLFVPLFRTNPDEIEVLGIFQDLSIEEPRTVNGVYIENESGGPVYDRGSEPKIEITGNPYATPEMGAAIYDAYVGKTYIPYSINGALFDPAAEVGDVINSKSDITHGLLISKSIDGGIAFHASISAPELSEYEDEYPYVSDIQSAGERVDQAIQVVEDLERRADSGEFAGEDAALLKISSSHGILFKSSTFQTELTVTVFIGGKEITTIAALREQFGPGAMLTWKWRKFDDEDFHTIASSDSRLSHDGFTLAITPEDVDEKIVFQCDLVS